MRTSLIDDLSPQGLVLAFDVAIDTLWMGVRNALKVAPMFCADWLVAELQGLFAHMESMAALARGSSRAMVRRHLGEMRSLVEAMFPVETVSPWSLGGQVGFMKEGHDAEDGRP